MKTQGEVEAAVCQGMSRFEQDYMGRGPQDILGSQRRMSAAEEQAEVNHQPNPSA